LELFGVVKFTSSTTARHFDVTDDNLLHELPQDFFLDKKNITSGGM
jgi:hypothetical protein